MHVRHNLITDVAGLKVGNAADEKLRSGVTVLLPDRPVVAALDLRGGGPGSRETDVLGLGATVQEIHGLVLSGGSAFGLAAATGVQSWLAARGIGFQIGDAVVPIVPQAILFDLLNGGDKDWGASPPYEELAAKACEACDEAGSSFSLGTAGAGFGATCADLKGGLGSASALTLDGITVGALVAVNPAGSVTLGETPQFWAAPFEQNGEFGGLGFPSRLPPAALEPRLKGATATNTTIAIVATDARLTRLQAHRLAVIAQTGLARAIYPVHTPLDGDMVFAISTARRDFEGGPAALARLGALAANTLVRAIARGVYEATGLPGTPPPSWRERFGSTAPGAVP